MSCIQLDGSPTPAKKGGEAVGYQGRKKAKTTNILFMTDSKGQPVAMAQPQAGNHNDVYQIRELFGQMCALLKSAGISLKGVFMNADAGFDTEVLRQVCEEQEMEVNLASNPRNKNKEAAVADYVYFDEKLYQNRYVIERTNAWLDGFKGLLIRYEKKIKSWMAQHFLAFITLLLRKLNTC